MTHVFLKIFKKCKKIAPLLVVVSFFAALSLGNYVYADYYSWSPSTSSATDGALSIASADDIDHLALVRVNLGNVVYTTTDGGSNWVANIVTSYDLSMRAIASNSGGDELVVAAYNDYVYRSTDTGNSWTALTGLGIGPWISVASDATGERLLVGSASNGLYVSGSAGDGWSSANCISGCPGSVIWSAVAMSSNGANQIAAVSGGQIYRSTDYGASWNAAPGSPNQNWTSLAISDDGLKIVATANAGYVYVSNDGGYNFSQAPIGAANWQSVAWQSVAMSNNGEIIAVVASGQDVYTSTDGGVSWEQEENSPNGLPKSIAMSSDGARLALASSDAYVYIATDSTQPTVAKITSDSADGFYKAGDTIDIDIFFSEPVNIANQLDVVFDTGGRCTIDATSEPTREFTCTYEVMQGEASADLSVTGFSRDLSLNVTDSIGNYLVDSQIGQNLDGNKNIVIDTTPPDAPNTAPDLLNEDDSGVSNSDNITNKNTLTFSGACPSNSIVKLYSDNILVGSSACSEGYSITSTQLSEGVHGMIVTYVDQAGNESEPSGMLSVTVDNTAQELTELSPTNSSYINNYTNASDVSFVSNEDLAIGSRIIITPTMGSDFNTHYCYLTEESLNAGQHTIDLSDTVNGCLGSLNSNYLNLPLVSGTGYTFTFETVDIAGNIGEPVVMTDVIFDSSAPSAPGIPDLIAAHDSGVSSEDNITNNTTLVFDISCEDGATVGLYSAEDTLIDTGICTDGSVQISLIDAVDGDHVFYAIQTDQAGNESTSSGTITVTVDTMGDFQDPSISPDLVGDNDSGFSNGDNVTSSTTLDFTGSDVGRCMDHAYLYLDGSYVSVAACVGWSYEISYDATELSEATHAFTIRYGDIAGNIGSASSPLNVTIDRTGPTTSGAPDLTSGSDSGNSSSDNVTNEATPTFTGSCTDGDIVILSVNDISTEYYASCSSSGFSSAANLSEGSNTITFVEYDVAGNGSLVSSALSVTLDTVSPIISEINPVTTPTDDTTPDYTFTTDSAGTISYGGSCTSTTTSATVGSNTITFNALSNGTYSNCTIRINDTAGNTSNILNVSTFVIGASESNTSSGGFSSTQTVGSGGVITSSSNQFTAIPLPAFNIASTTFQVRLASTTLTNINTVINAVDPIFTTPTKQSNLQTQKQVFINPNGTPFTFAKTLTTASAPNSDIKKLQVFLNSIGYPITKSGPGSTGNETNKFGSATKNALIKFQKDHGIRPAVGIFGPITRAYINSLLKAVK